MGNSICRELKGGLSEYAMGEKAEFFPGEKERLESHLAICPACRERLEEYKRLSKCMRMAIGIANIEVPEDVLERSRQRLDAMLKEKVAQMKAKTEAEARESTWPLATEAIDTKPAEDRPANIRRFPRWRTVAGIAASVLIAVGAGMWLCREPDAVNSSLGHQDVPSRSGSIAVRAESAQQNPSAVIHAEPSLAGRFSALTDSWDAIELLKTAFESEKQKSQPDFNEIINLSEKLIARWPDSSAMIEGQLLISRCYTQMADQEKARRAYIEYADAKGRWIEKNEVMRGLDKSIAMAHAQHATSTAIKQEADRLFRDADYLASLSFYDFLITRYPDSEVGSYALYKSAEYYSMMQQREESLAAYDQVIATSPSEYWKRLATISKASILFNLGRREESIKAWYDLAKSSDDPTIKAKAYYEAGFLCSLCGESRIPEAIENFKTVRNVYPNEDAARLAGWMLEKLNSRMADDIMKDVLSM